MLFRRTFVWIILIISVANSQNWKIITINNNRFKLDSLIIAQNDTLIGVKFDNTIKIPIQNIRHISYRFKTNRSNTNRAVGGAIGCGVGGCVGLIIGANVAIAMVDNYEPGLGIGLLGGALLGAKIFSSNFYLRKLYTIDDLTAEQKTDKINSIIEIYEH